MRYCPVVTKERTSIPAALAVQVLYEADRTCCVCRVNRQVQIHHIDEDPSNNTNENLAVLCLLCHDETQIRGGFARKLGAGLVRMYRDSWQGAIRLKLNPEIDESRRIFVAEVLQDVIQRCYAWRDGFCYMAAPKDQRWEGDAWTRAAELVPQTFDAVTYHQLVPMFKTGIESVKVVLDRAQLYGADVLPFDIRTLLLRARRQLDRDSQIYSGFLADYEKYAIKYKESQDRYYAGLFQGMLDLLRDIVDRCAARQQEVLGDIQLHEEPPEDDGY